MAPSDDVGLNDSDARTADLREKVIGRDSDSQAAAQAFPVEPPLKQIGRYRILEVISEGGMGVVYKAQQDHPIKRIVALKVIKPGMDSKVVLARFEAERQALALMDHPNVARVLDAGTTDLGRPYFVMEYVPG